MTQTSDSGASHRPGTFIALLFVLVTAIGFFAWRWMGRGNVAVTPDLSAAIAANGRGIGWIEQFNYPEAAAAFEEAVRFVPDWPGARINLGIALLNQDSPAAFDRAIELFNGVLKADPNNPHANFCLGIIYNHQSRLEDAAAYFEKVTQIDPNDATACYLLAQCLPSGDPKRVEYFEKAVKLDPYLSAAIYGLAMELRAVDMNKARALLAEQEALKQNLWDNPWEKKYGEMGHYATAIDSMPASTGEPRTGPIPLFARQDNLRVQLAGGARWATEADLGSGPIGDLRRLVRQRFGGTIAVLDYNGDGRLDILMLGAVVENGKVRDLLLRNDGGGQFTDVTRAAGLASDQPSLGCCVGDFDNDGLPDIFISGAGRQRLLRNTGKKAFEDVTQKSGLDALTTVCLGAGFLDLDQDGDLDLVVAQVAKTPEEALAALRSDKPAAGPGLAVFINVGEAPVASPSEDPAPLSVKFQRADKPPQLLAPGLAMTNVAFTDLDGDGDLDLIGVADHQPPHVIINDRLLRFHVAQLPKELAGAGRWNGVLPFDVNNDGRSDLLLVGPGQKSQLLINQTEPGRRDPAKGFVAGISDAPALLQAQAVDLDLDGWCDVVGLSDKRVPVLLHNDGKRLVHVKESLGADAAWPKEVLAITVADFDGDGYPDFALWSESAGLELYINQKNGNHGLFLEPGGHRHIGEHGLPMRSNPDGIGSVLRAHVGNQSTSVESATRSASLGQSRLPVVLGLGRHEQPEVVRIRWPDNVLQAEFGVPSGKTFRLEERNRRDTSCPVLFTWDGQRYVFVTDFLGAGSMGELGADGSTRPPRPEESVTIEAQQLIPVDGKLRLIVSGPMSEVIYLDRLQLQVVDHPEGVHVYPDERFAATGPAPTQDLLALGSEIFPLRAKDHRGKDVTSLLKSRDRQMVDDFGRRAWVGFAEDHWVELDFGDRLAKFGLNDPLMLCLAGWSDYAFPESIYAAGQAGVPMKFPSLERLGSDGKWQTIFPDIGIPAGLPRMMTVDVTGKLGGGSCVIRLSTNLHVFWDQIFVAPVVHRIAAAEASTRVTSSRFHQATPLEVARAELSSPGCAQEFSPDGKPPTMYDHGRTDPVPSTQLRGYLTRTGDVTELLRQRDDCFVIFGPGDEVQVEFDAGRLPKLPVGWKRCYVLRTWGNSKDPGPFTATNETVEPLPFAAMTSYPYPATEHYPTDASHEAYRRKYNTRWVGERR
jgi:hypothetical protein